MQYQIGVLAIEGSCSLLIYSTYLHQYTKDLYILTPHSTLSSCNIIAIKDLFVFICLLLLAPAYLLDGNSCLRTIKKWVYSWQNPCGNVSGETSTPFEPSRVFFNQKCSELTVGRISYRPCTSRYRNFCGQRLQNCCHLLYHSPQVNAGSKSMPCCMISENLLNIEKTTIHCKKRGKNSQFLSFIWNH